MIRILASDGMEKGAIAALEQKGCEVVCRFYDPEALKEAVKEFDALVVRSATKVRVPHIDAACEAGRLRIIIRGGVGVDNIDVKYAEEKGVAVVSILDYCTQETAENAFAMMLCLQRAIRIYDRSVQVDKEWNYLAAQHLQRIEGQTMGIVGLGRIGQSVARKAHGFDMRVIAYDPFLPPEIAEGIGVQLVDLDTLLAESDVVSIHMNLTKDNYHMFNKEVFKKMKKRPIIINEGRGPMICEEDLLWALNEGLVRAAGLDMLESENPDLSECKLLGRDDVLLMPHCGYFSDTSDYLVSKLSMENGIYYFNGDYDKVKVLRNNVKH